MCCVSVSVTPCVCVTDSELLCVCVLMFLEEVMPPYSKPSFPSPGAHSSSGTASSKGSTGPRKSEGQRGQQQQRGAPEHSDGNYLGTNGQPQYSGELCTCNIPQFLSLHTFSLPSQVWGWPNLLASLVWFKYLVWMMGFLDGFEFFFFLTGNDLFVSFLVIVFLFWEMTIGARILMSLLSKQNVWRCYVTLSVLCVMCMLLPFTVCSSSSSCRVTWGWWNRRMPCLSSLKCFPSSVGKLDFILYCVSPEGKEKTRRQRQQRRNVVANL